jgi:hypothetical protein
MTPATTLAAALAATALTLLPAAPATAAGAAEFPTLKSGQWEMTTTSGAAGSTPRKTTICLDASTQKAMLDMSAGMQKEMCTRMDIRRDGSKFITDAECRLGESVVKSHGVMTMIGDSAYHTESSATFDPPLNKDLRETKSAVDGKYVGACRDGLQPGDMVTANGQKINLNQIPQRPPVAK